MTDANKAGALGGTRLAVAAVAAGLLVGGGAVALSTGAGTGGDFDR